MKRLLLSNILLFTAMICFSNTIIVKNIEELNAANKQAHPGDIIILQNGKWENVVIALNCNGTKDQSITFKAQTPGKVIISGKSMLKLGGSYIIVDGLYFTNGYAGDDAVIDFRIDKNQLANDCRVTNCVIDDFNNPKRMDENNWVLFYGKNNKLDHCSFVNKKNMGVLLAVVLDDERSRENHHEIYHNYFGVRIPLASNGGEIIRVGVSQHCQFNSNTRIAYNFFEYCDGETEIISIKSGSNSVEQNIFKECQGSVVLRHGDDNFVHCNYFIGNDKPGTGGVRIINKGQIVGANVFYKCRGTGFRSPLAIMNGIPNSPANRYVQVTYAEIVFNTFYECAPMSLCEGSDAERTLAPDNVYFHDNRFYNTRDSIIYKKWDDIDGFTFEKNEVTRNLRQVLTNGFVKTNLPRPITAATSKDPQPEYCRLLDLPLMQKMLKKADSVLGAPWFLKKHNSKPAKPLLVNCKTAEEIYKQLSNQEPVIIRLTGTKYELDKPFIISKMVRFIGDKKTSIAIHTKELSAVFLIGGKGNLSIEDLIINAAGVNAKYFISNDTSGSVEHYNFAIRNSAISALHWKNGCEAVFFAHKNMVADSIVIRNSSFTDNYCNFFIMADEKDDKGYYSAEKIVFSQNTVNKLTGILFDIYRGGNDESTMGPNLVFTKNNLRNCNTIDTTIALIQLTGVQQSDISSNHFVNCNESIGGAMGKLIRYTDFVRANHILQKNSFVQSGSVQANKFVTADNSSQSVYQKNRVTAQSK